MVPRQCGRQGTFARKGEYISDVYHRQTTDAFWEIASTSTRAAVVNKPVSEVTIAADAVESTA